MLESLVIAVPGDTVSRYCLEGVDKFEKMTGILKTRWYSGNLSLFIKEALFEAGPQNYKDVKAVIVVTQTPDRFSPCMAVEVHEFLGLPKNVPAIDMNHACDGFIMGVWAGSWLSDKTLVICADQLRYGEKDTEKLIFSDAVSIAVTNSDGINNPVDFYTDGSQVRKLFCTKDNKMHMDGDSVFDFVTTKMPDFIKEFHEKNGGEYLVPHQANLSMLKILAKRAGFPDKCLYSIEEYGNQSMNSIPTCLAYNEEKILGSSVLLCGFGAGFTAAIMKMHWPKKKIARIVEI